MTCSRCALTWILQKPRTLAWPWTPSGWAERWSRQHVPAPVPGVASRLQQPLGPQARARALFWRTHKGLRSHTHTASGLALTCAHRVSSPVEFLGSALAHSTPGAGHCRHTLARRGHGSPTASWPWASGSSQPRPVMCIWGFWLHPIPQSAHHSLGQTRCQVLYLGLGAQV